MMFHRSRDKAEPRVAAKIFDRCLSESVAIEKCYNETNLIIQTIVFAFLGAYIFQAL